MHKWTLSTLFKAMACYLYGTKPLLQPVLILSSLSINQTSVDSLTPVGIEWNFDKCYLNIFSDCWPRHLPWSLEYKTGATSGCIPGMKLILLALIQLSPINLIRSLCKVTCPSFVFQLLHCYREISGNLSLLCNTAVLCLLKWEFSCKIFQHYHFVIQLQHTSSLALYNSHGTYSIQCCAHQLHKTIFSATSSELESSDRSWSKYAVL